MIFFNIIDNTLSIIESTTTRLQPNEVRAIQLLVQNSNKEINTLDLLEKGISSPNQCIGRLKQKGALFDVTYRKVVDIFGNVRHGIACYRLVGWK
tara:strand:- start:40458 stop:40742 length:285 start_codon:yes stop_codon:yes gene_type:complete